MLIEKIQINTNSITATFNTGGNYISINMTGVRRACGDAEIGRCCSLIGDHLTVSYLNYTRLLLDISWPDSYEFPVLE